LVGLLCYVFLKGQKIFLKNSWRLLAGLGDVFWVQNSFS